MSRLALVVDVVLLAVVLSLFSPRATGLPLHEWIGLGLFGIILVHLLLSWAWIATSTRRIFAPGHRRTRINLALNWLLFVLVLVEVVSGVMISRVALPAFGVATVEDGTWRALHNQTLNWTLLVLGVHIAMNWQALIRGVQRYFWSGARAGG